LNVVFHVSTQVPLEAGSQSTDDTGFPSTMRLNFPIFVSVL
jgi:hypothetical protein